MPRKPRLSVPGAIHHVMSRGIDGRDLFADDEDRRVFLRMAGTFIAKAGFNCYAWVLMANHYHLVLRCNEAPLSTLMRPLNGAYARYHAKRHKRRGYLFQDRFKSIVTQDQGYVEELIRYVHLNPVRAGVCRALEQLDSYPWCGHAEVMGRSQPAFLCVSAVLKRFSRDATAARRKYREFIQAGLDGASHGPIEQVRASNRGSANSLDHAGWVLGDPEFVARALAADEQNRLQLAEHVRSGWSLGTLADTVARQMGIESRDLYRRGHGNARAAARKVFAYLAHRKLGITGADVARHLGVCGAAVSRSLDDGERIADEQGIRLINQSSPSQGVQ